MNKLYQNVKSYYDILIELGTEDPNIFVINAEMGKPERFVQKFPDRFVEVGIAEQNLIGISAGLALRGKIPFILAMAPFATMRAFEQIRTDLAYGERNVKIIGLFTGISSGPWGTTHHAIEDFAIMRVIPGMTVISCVDALETEKAIRAVAKHVGVTYMRYGIGTPVYEEDYDFKIGKAVTMRDGDDITIVATGKMVEQALKAREILVQQGIQARVINMHTIKPIDEEILIKAAKDTKGIVTVEEHSIIGGLAGAVAEVLASSGIGRLKRIGLNDTFCTKIGPYEDLCKYYGLTAEKIVENCLELCGK